MINTEKIKEQLEDNKTFKYAKEEIGLSFEDFDLIDQDTNELISRGKKDIGIYALYLKNDLIIGAFFDFREEPTNKDIS